MGTCHPFIWNLRVFNKYSTTWIYLSWVSFPLGSSLWGENSRGSASVRAWRKGHQAMRRGFTWSRINIGQEQQTNEKPFWFHLKYNACIFHILNKGLQSRCFIFAVFLEAIFPLITLATRYSLRKTFLPFHRIDASKRGLSVYTSSGCRVAFSWNLPWQGARGSE